MRGFILLWAPIVLVLPVPIFIFTLKKKLILKSNFKHIIPIIFLVLGLFFEYKHFKFILPLLTMKLDISNDYVPLHLCNLSAILIYSYIITQKKSLMEIGYLTGISGGFITLFVTPKIIHDIGSFQFIYGHMMLIVIPLYYVIVEEFQLCLKSVFKALAFTVVAGVINIHVNIIYGTEYMHLLPDNTRNLYSFITEFGKWPYNLFTGLLAAVIIYFTLYFITKLWQDFSRK